MLSEKISRVGPYKLGALIKRVGPIMVYEGYHEEVWVRRSIKVLPAIHGKPDPSIIYVSSPYLARVYEVGVEREWSYAAEEWNPWPTLREIAKTRRLTSKEGESLLHDLLHAVISLRKAGLDHRYLVPDLILATPGGFVLEGAGVAHLLRGHESHADIVEIVKTYAEVGASLMRPLRLVSEGRLGEALASLRSALDKRALERLARVIVMLADISSPEATVLRRKTLALLSRRRASLEEVEALEEEVKRLLSM